ncbi:MAG: hypothetical protein KTR33_11760 [Gammaproteobacteria bacterium]|nr:hypothetical protein [Gammaproteobacteria bacterium]
MGAQIFTDAAFDQGGGENWGTGGGGAGSGTNNYELWEQGHNGSPTIGNDGLATGQHLEIRGNRSSGQITVTVDIPNDVRAGTLAEARFESWFNGGTSGTIRVRRTNNSATNLINTNFSDVDSGGTAALNDDWDLNSYTFTVSPGDRIQFRFRNNPRNNGDPASGLHIDDVQLIVDIVPEPGQVATLLLAVVMASCWFKRRLPQQRMALA